MKKYSSLVDFINEPLDPILYLDSGFEGINKIVGGYCSNEVTLICAPSSGGKSLIAINSAIMMAEKGYKVLYFSCENSEIDDCERIKSCLKRNNWNGESFKFTYINNDNNNVQFKDLSEEIEENDYDVVFLDSIDFVDLDVQDGTGLYNAYGRIMSDLRNLARSQKVAIIATSQLVRESSSKTIDNLSIADIANSIKLPRIAHDVWVISKNESWSFKIVKNRGPLLRDETIFSCPHLYGNEAYYKFPIINSNKNKR